MVFSQAPDLPTGIEVYWVSLCDISTIDDYLERFQDRDTRFILDYNDAGHTSFGRPKTSQAITNKATSSTSDWGDCKAVSRRGSRLIHPKNNEKRCRRRLVTDRSGENWRYPRRVIERFETGPTDCFQRLRMLLRWWWLMG